MGHAAAGSLRVSRWGMPLQPVRQLLSSSGHPAWWAGRNSTLLCTDCCLQACRRFAKLSSRRGSKGRPAADCGVHGMVMNVGERPTMADGGGVTVEVLGSPGPGAACRFCFHVFCLLSFCSTTGCDSGTVESRLLMGLGGQVHVFDHEFSSDFYGLDMTVLICGFLRCSQALLVDSMACVADCPPSCL
jgi:hypothetical protein